MRNGVLLLIDYKKIFHTIVRHCTSSKNSTLKARPPGFDRQALFKLLLENSIGQTSMTVILDSKDNDPLHFTQAIGGEWLQVRRGAYGSDAASFRAALYFVLQKDWSDDDIVCFLEDDYLVSKDWIPLIREGLAISDYVTLYDHPDKYSEQYRNIPCMLYKQPMRHWRTTPSTTNSYAMTVKTLKRDIDIHFKSCEGVGITRDHSKFLEIWDRGCRLVSCIPSAWSHEEQGMTVEVI